MNHMVWVRVWGCVCVCVSWTEPSAPCYLHVWFSSSLAVMGAYNRHPSGHDADLVCLSTPCKPEWGWDQCRSPPGSRLVVCAFVSMWISVCWCLHVLLCVCNWVITSKSLRFNRSHRSTSAAVGIFYMLTFPYVVLPNPPITMPDSLVGLFLIFAAH